MMREDSDERRVQGRRGRCYQYLLPSSFLQLHFSRHQATGAKVGKGNTKQEQKAELKECASINTPRPLSAHSTTNQEAVGRPAGADSHEAHTGTRQSLIETLSRSYRE